VKAALRAVEEMVEEVKMGKMVEEVEMVGMKEHSGDMCIRKGQKGKRLNNGLRKNIRGRPRIESMRLIKSNVSRNPHTMSNRIPTMIALVFSTVSQENTFNRLRCQFSAFTRSKRNIAQTSKKVKIGVIRCMSTKALIWDATLKSG